MKKYTMWLKSAVLFQMLFAAIHALSLFVDPPPTNETEKQLFMLMDTYRFDLGSGFHRTMNDLTFVFSACLTLFMLFGGLINGYLLWKKAGPDIMKGVLTINLAIFGACFVVIAAGAFLFPIVLSGLIVLSLILARVTLPARPGKQSTMPQ